MQDHKLLLTPGMRLSLLPTCLSLNTPYDVLEHLLDELPKKYATRLSDQSNKIPEELILNIIRRARELFMVEPIVVRLEPPVYICGDIHGQYYDLVNIFCRRPPLGGRFFGNYFKAHSTTTTAAPSSTGGKSSCQVRPEPMGRPMISEEWSGEDFSAQGTDKSADSIGCEPSPKRPRKECIGSEGGGGGGGGSGGDGAPDYAYLFLGDYVDRGTRSIEVMVTLLSLKIISPAKMILLRGNHECSLITRTYGFMDECKRRYSLRLYKAFVDLFAVLPVAAVVGEGICCMHGGISPDIVNLSLDVPDVRPCEIPNSGILCDLLWSDPDQEGSQTAMMSDTGWSENPYRGISYIFSEVALTKFLEDNDFDLVCRAHQVVQTGYKFFPSNDDRKLVTIFSATNYVGGFCNRGGMMVVDANMMCSFLTFSPPSCTKQAQLINNMVRLDHTFIKEWS